MEGLKGQIIALLLMTTGMLITPLIFIALDYWAGIRKARKRGDKILSNKMRRTVEKISRYYNAILAMMVVDCIQIATFIFMHLYYGTTAWTIPIFTMGAVLFVAAIEIKSIYEPADVKESREVNEVSTLLAELIEKRDDPKKIAKIIAQYLQSNDAECKIHKAERGH